MNYYRDHSTEYATYGNGGCVYAIATVLFALIATIALLCGLAACLQAQRNGSMAGANAVTAEQLESQQTETGTRVI